MSGHADQASVIFISRDHSVLRKLISHRGNRTGARGMTGRIEGAKSQDVGRKTGERNQEARKRSPAFAEVIGDADSRISTLLFGAFFCEGGEGPLRADTAVMRGAEKPKMP